MTSERFQKALDTMFGVPELVPDLPNLIVEFPFRTKAG